MKHLLAAALAAALFSYGCAGRGVRPPADSTLPADPAAYLAAVCREAAAVTDVSGFAKLRMKGPRTSAATRNVFFAKRPGLLRIETLGFLSRPAFILTADTRTMQVYDVGGNAVFAGPTTPENFTRIIGLPLELGQIVEAFFGQPPLLDCPDKRIDCAAVQGEFAFSVVCGSLTEQITVDPRTRRISSCKLLDNGVPVFSCSFSRFHAFERTVFPLKIEIYHYTYKAAVTLELESLSFEPITPERFELRAPRSVEVLPFEALNGSP